MRPIVENCMSIDIGRLQKAIKKDIKRDYPYSSVEEKYKITQEELSKFSINGQTFNYQAVESANFKGYRWYFSCPKCETKVNKLYLPPAGVGLDNVYLCKTCHGLKHRSALMGQNNKLYKKVFKPMRRLKDIENKLQKGYLGATKIEELLDEYDKIEAEMKNCPEYRLYRFRKEHGIEKKQG